MAPLLADLSQGETLRLYEVECLARRPGEGVDPSRRGAASPLSKQLAPRTEAVLASPRVYIQIVKTAGVPRAAPAEPHPQKDAHAET